LLGDGQLTESVGVLERARGFVPEWHWHHERRVATNQQS
jgi:hypothetical protein